jgi:hypothetical protein
VVVPVTATGTVLDVKIVEISTATPSGGVAPITALHEAVETALEEADTYSGSGVIVDYPAYVNNTTTNDWSVRRDDGILLTGQIYKTTNNSYVQGKDFLLHNGNRVQFTGSITWQQVNITPASISVNQNPSLLYGVCEGYSGNHMLVRSDDDGLIYNANTIRISGTSPEVDVASYANSGFSIAEKLQLRGLRVSTNSTDALTVSRNWRTVDFFPNGFSDNPEGDNIGFLNWATTNSGSSWYVITLNGTQHSFQTVLDHATGTLLSPNNTVAQANRGRRVGRKVDQANAWITLRDA